MILVLQVLTITKVGRVQQSIGVLVETMGFFVKGKCSKVVGGKTIQLGSEVLSGNDNFWKYKGITSKGRFGI